MAGSKIVFAKGTQLTVYIDNRKGTLSALATFLGKHGVNIYGLTLADTEGHGYARLIVDDTEKARQLVEDAGELVAAREVLLIRDAELWPGTPRLKRLAIGLIRRLVLSTYLTEYRALTGMTPAEIEAWRLTAVVLRMSTLDIDSERPRFQRELTTLLEEG